ncbi:hypothetical protein [Anianabacter salinae]|uniref:hypothetical protein n=1 Tax=Anianabacter salinae TaxID=2851023 RepID=UPI00225E27D9|nr:hypothetical protein [Anianabacter salinae]MBV0911119.1 hypothetical protein [Anianabacter salinae]
MRRVGLAQLWALAAGLFLWCPAIAVPGLRLPLQPLDLLAPFGLLLAAMYLRRLPPLLLPVLGTGMLSVLASAAFSPADPITLVWTLWFAFPFVLGLAIAAGHSGARAGFLLGFSLGAAASGLLFAAQIVLGSETLDFRDNFAFRLPAQYGRAFALMPEVSTYAVHAILAASIATAFLVHPASRQRTRLVALPLAIGLAATLVLTRSTGVIVLLPVTLVLALVIATRASANALTLMLICVCAMAVLLIAYVETVYVERLASASAERSGAMRLASMLGGVSVLATGDLFGVGIGQNHEIARYAYETARTLGLSFGALPDGVNSQVIGRIFEEGWPAVLHLGLAGAILVRSMRRWPDPGRAAIALLAAGSALAATGILGYRGLYTAWIWLALPAGLLCERDLARWPRGAR